MIITLTGIALTILFILSVSPMLFHHLYEKLLYKDGYTKKHQFVHVLENRSGVITATASGRIYGGGVYDGAYSVNLLHDINGIERAFAVGALHESPAEVLMIGMGSGSWAIVVANHPTVQHLTIVEINPGYVSLLRKYRDHTSLLQNPKVEIVIDDGRRWLRRNPNRHFDAIVANTTWNWRSHATNLLSAEFLQIVRMHLKKGGIYFYNTTDSRRAARTGAVAFPFALKFAGCLAVSDSPIHFQTRQWRTLLERYRINGNPVFDLSNPKERRRLNEIVHNAKNQIEKRDKVLTKTTGLEIITDDNMGTEWQGHL